MTFHAKGLIGFVAFAAVMLLALNTPYGPLAIAAGIAIELLLWSGVFGFGRAPRSGHPR